MRGEIALRVWSLHIREHNLRDIGMGPIDNNECISYISVQMTLWNKYILVHIFMEIIRQIRICDDQLYWRMTTHVHSARLSDACVH